MTFEYHGFQRFWTMKHEFVYFFDSSIVLEPIVSWHKNSGICGSSIGPTLLMPCCVEAISIHVITSKWLDPIGTAIGNLPQLGTHRHIVLGLHVQEGKCIILFARTNNGEYHTTNEHYLLFEPRNEIQPTISRTMSNKCLSFLESRRPWWTPELRMKFPIWKIHDKVGWKKGSTQELKECSELTVCTAGLRNGWWAHIAL